MKRYVISDLHLGHQGILKYRTEFSNLEQMHSCIIENWNNVVTAQDKVYILGDVAFNKTGLALLESMNGKKVLIKGNHDILKLKEYLKYFEDIRGAMVYQDCILTHIPIVKSQLENRFRLNVHGHLHDKKVTKIYLPIIETTFKDNVITNKFGDSQDIPDDKYINVCVEHTGYKPVLLEDIINA